MRGIYVTNEHVIREYLRTAATADGLYTQEANNPSSGNL